MSRHWVSDNAKGSGGSLTGVTNPRSFLVEVEVVSAVPKGAGEEVVANPVNAPLDEAFASKIERPLDSDPLVPLVVFG